MKRYVSQLFQKDFLFIRLELSVDNSSVAQLDLPSLPPALSIGPIKYPKSLNYIK